MALTTATITSSSNNVLITIFCLRLYIKDFDERFQKTMVIGELQVLKIVTHEQILLTILSAQSDVTQIKISIFINPIKIFRIPRIIFFKINILFLTFDADLESRNLFYWKFRLNPLMQDFKSVSDHFGTLCIKGLKRGPFIRAW